MYTVEFSWWNWLLLKIFTQFIFFFFCLSIFFDRKRKKNEFSDSTIKKEMPKSTFKMEKKKYDNFSHSTFQWKMKCCGIKLCKTTINYTLWTLRLLKNSTTKKDVWTKEDASEHREKERCQREWNKIDAARSFAEIRNVKCQIKTLPFASYTVFKSILNEPTTVPDRRNFLEWST